MYAATNYDASSPQASLHSGGPGSDFSKSSTSLKTSSGGDTLKDSESSREILARYELDIACISEKLTNLNLLSMHVENKESDLESFEAFVSDLDPNLVLNVLEYDILSGFLDSEVKSLETRICELQMGKANVREFLSSRKHIDEPLIGMEDMLYDSETSLEQSMEQVLEIKIRIDNFDRNLLRFAGDEDYTDSLNNSDPLGLQEKMKMQTVEHQRHVLRMLEKSLDREIELEKRVSELTQIEDALKIRLHLSEKEVFKAEVEAETILEKYIETNNTSDLLMETSRELISKMKMLEFNLKGSDQREAELKNAFLKLEERFNEKESTEGTVKMEKTIKYLREEIVVNAEDNCRNETETTQELNDTYEKMISLEKELSDANVKLQNAEACFEASEEDRNMLKSTIKDMGNVIDDMKKKVTKAETENESLEDKCIFLSESNRDLKKELSFVMCKLKGLETTLHQMEEDRNMLKSTIKDMGNVIDDMKKKVTKAETENDSLEDKCIFLSESNRDLKKELSFVMCKLKGLETTLHQMEETTMESAKDITLRSKLITDLVRQMSLERERLQNKISSLKQENKILVQHVKISDVDPVVKVSDGDKASCSDFTTENKEVLSTNFEVEKASTETVRNIDASQLKPKDIMRVLLILIIPILGYFFIKP